MQYGTRSIAVPDDNPAQFDPAWRASLASAIVNTPYPRVDPEYKHLVEDEWVQRQVSYLRKVQKGYTLGKGEKDLRLASLWSRGTTAVDVRYKIEPLLITPVSFEVISDDIAGGAVHPDAFKTYERLYFNIRNDDGTMNRSCFTRTYFAMPTGPLTKETPDETIWKVVAANQGYSALAAMWLWSDAHGTRDTSQQYLTQELWRIMQSNLFVDVYSKRVGHFDLIELMGKVIDYEKLQAEKQDADAQTRDAVATFSKLLALTRPQMLHAADTVDKTTAALAKKMLEAPTPGSINSPERVVIDALGTFDAALQTHFQPQKG